MLMVRRRNVGLGGEGQRGLTLIEAITTVAILGILSAIGVNYYDKQKLESHRSEAIIALTTLAQLQERYMNANGSYANSIALLNPPPSIVTAADKTQQGLYSLTLTNTSTALNSNCSATAADGTTHYYCYTLTATAISSQTADTACTSFILDQTGKQSSTGTGTDCWAK